MMKHSALTIAFALAALLPLCGCAKKTATSTTGNGVTTMNNNNSKSLVVCFSATGNTKGVAQRLAEAIGAEFVEIVPAKPYTAADLDWRDKNSRSSVEMADRKSRPAIATAAPDLADYATVFVGFPIWWYREPSIIDTFVESNAEAFDGKTIVPFATSGGSGMGDSTANLQALAPKAKVVEGRRFSVNVDADTLRKWAAEFTK